MEGSVPDVILEIVSLPRHLDGATEKYNEKLQSGYPVTAPRLETELPKYDTEVLPTLPPVMDYILNNVGFNFRLQFKICCCLRTDVEDIWTEEGRNGKRLERTEYQ